MKKFELTEKTAIHCPTEELANKVLEIGDKLGYRWSSTTSFLKNNHYNCYGKDTCYSLITGEYCNFYYFKNENYTIIPAEDFIKQYGSNKKNIAIIILKNILCLCLIMSMFFYSDRLFFVLFNEKEGFTKFLLLYTPIFISQLFIGAKIFDYIFKNK